MCNKCYLLLKPNIELKIDKYTDKFFDEHIYYTKYESLIRHKILNYKFKEQSYLYKFFSEIILKNKKIYLLLKFYDIIIPIPISKKRKKLRGYNQAELIAREISKKINISLKTDIIFKTKNNKKQSDLNKEERIENVKNVYMIKNANIIKDKKILLIDDIFTTGATVNECSKILKEAGALSVGVLSISKD